jgi:hypothetical protein
VPEPRPGDQATHRFRSLPAGPRQSQRTSCVLVQVRQDERLETAWASRGKDKGNRQLKGGKVIGLRIAARCAIAMAALAAAVGSSAQTTAMPALLGRQTMFAFAGQVTQVTRGPVSTGQPFCVEVTFDGRRAKVGTNKPDQVTYLEGIADVAVVWPDGSRTSTPPTTNNPSASNALHVNPQQSAWSGVTQVYATAYTATTFQLQLRTPTQYAYVRNPKFEFQGRLVSSPVNCQ